MFGNQKNEGGEKKFVSTPPHKIGLKIQKEIIVDGNAFRGFTLAKYISGDYVCLKYPKTSAKDGITKVVEETYSLETMKKLFGNDSILNDKPNLAVLQSKIPNLESAILKNVDYSSNTKSPWVHDQAFVQMTTKNGKHYAEPFYGYLTKVVHEEKTIEKKVGGVFKIDNLILYFVNPNNEWFQMSLKYTKEVKIKKQSVTTVNDDVKNILRSLDTLDKFGLFMFKPIYWDEPYFSLKEEKVYTQQLKKEFGENLFVTENGKRTLKPEILAKYSKWELKSQRKYWMDIYNVGDFKYSQNTFEVFFKKNEKNMFILRDELKLKALGDYPKPYTEVEVNGKPFVVSDDTEHRKFFEALIQKVNKKAQDSKATYSIFDPKQNTVVSLTGKPELPEEPVQDEDEERFVGQEPQEGQSDVVASTDDDDDDLPF